MVGVGELALAAAAAARGGGAEGEGRHEQQHDDGDEQQLRGRRRQRGQRQREEQQQRGRRGQQRHHLAPVHGRRRRRRHGFLLRHRPPHGTQPRHAAAGSSDIANDQMCSICSWVPTRPYINLCIHSPRPDPRVSDGSVTAEQVVAAAGARGLARLWLSNLGLGLEGMTGSMDRGERERRRSDHIFFF